MKTPYVLFVLALLCAAAVTPARSQESRDSKGPTISLPAPATSVTGPRLSAPFQPFEPIQDRSHASASSSVAAAAGGQHTIVISTLALVLVVVLVVLLAVN